MKDLKKIWIKIIGGIREKTFKYGKKRKDLNFCYVDELPEIVKETTVYIVGEKGHYWQLGFKCPCKCGDLIQLNLLKEASPQWEFRINNSNTITIFPSIWKETGCKSHFFVRRSNIVWIRDYWAGK